MGEGKSGVFGEKFFGVERRINKFSLFMMLSLGIEFRLYWWKVSVFMIVLIVFFIFFVIRVIKMIVLYVVLNNLFYKKKEKKNKLI